MSRGTGATVCVDMVVVTYGCSGPCPVTGTGTTSGKRGALEPRSAGALGWVTAGKGGGITAGSTLVRAFTASVPCPPPASALGSGTGVEGAAGSTIGESTGGIVAASASLPVSTSGGATTSAGPSAVLAGRAFARGVAGAAGAARLVIELDEAPRCDDEPRAGAGEPAAGVFRRLALVRDAVEGALADRDDLAAASPFSEGSGACAEPFPEGPSGDGPLPASAPAFPG